MTGDDCYIIHRFMESDIDRIKALSIDSLKAFKIKSGSIWSNDILNKYRHMLASDEELGFLDIAVIFENVELINFALEKNITSNNNIAFKLAGASGNERITKILNLGPNLERLLAERYRSETMVDVIGSEYIGR